MSNSGNYSRRRGGRRRAPRNNQAASESTNPHSDVNSHPVVASSEETSAVSSHRFHNWSPFNNLATSDANNIGQNDSGIGETAAAESLQNNVSSMEVINCMICFSGFTRRRLPKVLHCGHSFCSACVKRIGRSHFSVTCPTCRTVSNCHHSNLATNFQFVDLLDELHLLKEDDGEPIEEDSDDAVSVAEDTDADEDTEDERFPDVAFLREGIDNMIDRLTDMETAVEAGDMTVNEIRAHLQNAHLMAEEASGLHSLLDSVSSQFDLSNTEVNSLQAHIEEDDEGNPLHENNNNDRYDRYERARGFGFDDLSSEVSSTDGWRSLVSLLEETRAEQQATEASRRLEARRAVFAEEIEISEHLELLVEDTDRPYGMFVRCTLCHCTVPSGEENRVTHMIGRRHRQLLRARY